MNRTNIPLLLAILLPLTESLEADTRIEGRVRLPERAAEPTDHGRYKIKTSGPVRKPDPLQAIIYLEGNVSEPKTPSDKKVELGQKHYQFQPGVLPVQKGTRVEFPNYDDDYHNVFSYSKIKRFDLGRYRKDEKPPVQVFDKAGVVKLYCEIHEHMRGTILVLDTPYFTKTDADGNFRLENLPTGSYTLKAWLDEKTVWQKPVELKEGETLKVDFN